MAIGPGPSGSVPPGLAAPAAGTAHSRASSGALAAVPLFAMLGADRLATLAARSRVRIIGTGRVVAVHGQPSAHLIVVETGALTAMRETAQGQRLRLGEFAAPCVVDKAAVLDGGGYTATWVASTLSRLRLVPAADLLAIIDEVPAARRHVLAHLSSQLRDQQDDLVHASFGDAITRTAAWLLRAAGKVLAPEGTALPEDSPHTDGLESSRALAQRIPPQGSRVTLPGAQQGLAEGIGMSRVSVNRALRALTRAGIIRVERGAVVILAPELLVFRASRG